MNVLASAARLADDDLLARLDVLAASEREVTVELLAHLAALDSRPNLYAARGYGSLFTYCTQALHLSEDATCNRIHAARACRRFPMILDDLASGALTLSAVRLLAPHLTPENHQAVLATAKGRTFRQVEHLVAELAPEPDRPSSIRKLPAPSPSAAVVPASPPELPELVAPSLESAAAAVTPPGVPAAASRPIVKPIAAERYRVQFTIGQGTQDKLRRLQTLLRREIPDGDPAILFDRAITMLLEQVEARKLGRTKGPGRATIRRATDGPIRTPVIHSRAVPRWVKRHVHRRDGGRCTFVSPDGRRCTEQEFLEFHHRRPWVLDGPETPENIALRCRRHNQYEADVVFGTARRRGVEARARARRRDSRGPAPQEASPAPRPACAADRRTAAP